MRAREERARERREAEALAHRFLDVGPFRLGGRAVIEAIRRRFHRQESPGAPSTSAKPARDSQLAAAPETSIGVEEYEALLAEREELRARVAELRRHLEQLEADTARRHAEDVRLAAGAALMRDAERRAAQGRGTA